MADLIVLHLPTLSTQAVRIDKYREYKRLVFAEKFVPLVFGVECCISNDSDETTKIRMKEHVFWIPADFEIFLFYWAVFSANLGIRSLELEYNTNSNYSRLF